MHYYSFEDFDRKYHKEYPALIHGIKAALTNGITRIQFDYPVVAL
jgi:hypothetical protein